MRYYSLKQVITCLICTRQLIYQRSRAPQI